MRIKRTVAVLSVLTFMGMLMTGCNTSSSSSVVDETEVQTEMDAVQTETETTSEVSATETVEVTAEGWKQRAEKVKPEEIRNSIEFQSCLYAVVGKENSLRLSDGVPETFHVADLICIPHLHMSEGNYIVDNVSGMFPIVSEEMTPHKVIAFLNAEYEETSGTFTCTGAAAYFAEKLTEVLNSLYDQSSGEETEAKLALAFYEDSNGDGAVLGITPENEVLVISYFGSLKNELPTELEFVRFTDYRNVICDIRNVGTFLTSNDYFTET